MKNKKKSETFQKFPELPKHLEKYVDFPYGGLTMNVGETYTDGSYLKNNPTWHSEDAKWKADHIYRMIKKHNLRPQIICDVGCGTGGVLKHLQEMMPASCQFTGYEVSPQVYGLTSHMANNKLVFRYTDITKERKGLCDLILLIDVIEHLENYFTFLRNIKDKSHYKILHIPLEMFALSVMYPKFIMGQRKKVGHLHHFSKETALKTLEDTGYEVIDYNYTAGYSLSREYGMKDKLLKIPRKLLFPFSNDLTMRIFGGYSLLVLAV